MSQALQILLGTAMIDGQFCELLLNGGRQELLPKFKLTDEEHRFLLGIKADSLEGFAAAVDQWLSAKSHCLICPGTGTDTAFDFPS
ncbi:MAG TPA: hypothetical protein EYP49_18735 [Anaerolineae bacterium]|nr:hypothetical protein [Anaerolineae bacterium]